MLSMLLRVSVLVAVVGLAVSLRPSQPALAVVHLAEIHEIMVGADGDTDVQFVEVNMRTVGQNITNNAKLATFDSTGTFIDADPGTGGDQPLATMNGNVPNGGNGVRWIIGTTEFELATGMQADFEFPANPGLPTSVGMVCIFEAARDFTDPTESIDCVAYGGASFTGSNPNSNGSEAATTGPGDGTLSLTRINPASLGISPPWAKSNDATDFDLLCPTPENNAGEIGFLGPDADSDGLPDCNEAIEGTDDQDPDTDDDTCEDGKEAGNIDPDGAGPNGPEHVGGLRDPLNSNDFFDPNGDESVDLPNDILGVILRWTPNPSQPYNAAFDRGALKGGAIHPWSRLPADGTIDLPNDILGIIQQWQHNCS